MKDLKPIIINAIITLIVSMLFESLYIYIFHNQGKIELITSKLNNNYQTIISINNLQKEEYLKDIEIKINEEIGLIEWNINGKQDTSLSILIDKINPKEIRTIHILSTEKTSKDDFTFVKNNQKIEIESFNDYTDYKLRYFVLILIYVIVNIILSIPLQRKNKESIEKYNKECDLLNSKVEELEKKTKNMQKEDAIKEALYIKEMNDLEKENELYKVLLKEKIKLPLSQDEFEKIIYKKLKTVNRKNIQHFNYEDIVKIVSTLTDIQNQ